MKKINLNSTVKVKLNDRGKDIYYHRFDDLNRFIKSRGAKPLDPRYPVVDEDGFSEFQLWSFMHLYGEYMMVGAPNITEDLNIYINDEDLDDI